MQLSGIGHDSDTHHVTNCMHNHSHYDKTGEMGGAASSAGMNAQSFTAAQRQADAQLSLSAWLEKTLSSGRRLWRGIWGSEDTAAAGRTGNQSGAEQTMAQINAANVAESTASGGRQSDRLHAPQIAAAATAVTQPQELYHTPYFSEADLSAKQQGNLWQRVKVRFKNVAGQLARHLPGKFFSAHTKGSFQARQERPREDLRKRGALRRDTVEINSMLTEDSYLLDSYDRKGEYSKLSAK